MVSASPANAAAGGSASAPSGTTAFSGAAAPNWDPYSTPSSQPAYSVAQAPAGGTGLGVPAAPYSPYQPSPYAQPPSAYTGVIPPNFTTPSTINGAPPAFNTAPTYTPPPPPTFGSAPPYSAPPYAAGGPYGGPAYSSTPSALYPDAVPGATRPFFPPSTQFPALQQPMRLLQGVWLRDTWLASTGGSQALTVNTTETSTTFAVPLGYAYAQPPLLITPGFGVDFWGGPSTMPPANADLPPETYEAYLDIAWQPRVNQWLSFNLGAAPASTPILWRWIFTASASWGAGWPSSPSRPTCKRRSAPCISIVIASSCCPPAA